jgi:arsenate reductase (glutaredoxin)
VVGRHVDSRPEVEARPPPGGRRVGPKQAAGVSVQVFGRRDSRPTQKALRFFSERRILASLVDLARKPMAPGELRRFADKFGGRALLDPESARYQQLGLAHLTMDDAEAFERVLDDQRLLRLPLIRAGGRLSIGLDEASWRALLSAE